MSETGRFGIAVLLAGERRQEMYRIGWPQPMNVQPTQRSVRDPSLSGSERDRAGNSTVAGNQRVVNVVASSKPGKGRK
jgi:hypothetical protein